jgi:cyclophilin family peptidyl-prolyl cis-trans isomerase
MKPFLLCFLLSICTASAQIDALFTTSVGDFTVRLDQHNAPLATANFMLLAGIPDDSWEEQSALAFPADQVPYAEARPGVLYRRLGRLVLNVLYQESLGQGDAASYVVRQGRTILGRTKGTANARGVFEDITGKGIVEIHQEPFTNNFSIHIKHRRKWLDNREGFRVLRDAPMYLNIPVTQIDSGRRFFAGTVTNDPNETVGYRFPDEIARNNPTIPPWGNSFSQGWVLAMDNQLRNSNGSRFFITGLPLPGDFLLMKEWNKRYTAFGTVLTTGAGRNVINTILGLGEPDGTPKAAINIQSIEIKRISDGALGFFPHLIQEHLPGESNPLPLRIEKTDTTLDLITPLTPKSQRIFLTSSDLKSDRTVFFSSIPPFEFEENRLDLLPTVALQPKSFFEAFWVQIPEWPSKEFAASGARIRCHNVNENGLASGSVELTFNTVPLDNPNGILPFTSGTFRVTLPAKTIQFPDGSSTSFPQMNSLGTFTSTYEADTDPFRGVLSIITSQTNGGSSATFPFEFFNLNFDYRLGTVLDQRISRFSAGSDTTGYDIDGVWQKNN